MASAFHSGSKSLQDGITITFAHWLPCGIPTAVLSIAICAPYLLLRYA